MAKKECRTLSLRGTFELADHARIVDHQIFQYESPARNIGWRITGAWIWPETVAENTAGDHQATMTANLATDTQGNPGGLMSVDDNRQCAWAYNAYYIRADGANEFLNPIGLGLPDQRFLIDPDTVVTNALYINAWMYSEAADSPERTWNYMVTLESMSITPSESILQQLKGIGQDIDN